MCICVYTTDMPFIHSRIYFSPIEEFVICYYSFSLLDIMVDKSPQSQKFQFSMKTTVGTFVVIYTHIYGKYIYTHSLVFSANASWIVKKM